MKIFILSILFQITMCDYDRRIITTLKYSKHAVKPTIVNGAPAHEGDVPYLVSLKEPAHKMDEHRIVWKNLCGGSIIGVLKVVTAAHCFEANNFYYAHHPRKLRVVAGELRSVFVHSGDTETSERTQIRNLDKVIVHKNFNFPANDIALVFVDAEWNYTTHVDYIVLASKTTDYRSSCVAAGFGSTGHGVRAASTPVLLVASIQPMSRWRCSILWEMNMNGFICTHSALTDVARGDSGGPLACQRTDDPEELPGKKLLAGVVSGKNFDKTTLYTRISEYRGWIDRNIANKRRMDIALVFLIYFLSY